MKRLWLVVALVVMLGPVAAQDLIQLFNEGVKLYQEGKTDEALTVFQKVVTTNPDDGEAWIWIGTILLLKKDYDEAISAFEKGLAKPLPASVKAKGWVNLGLAYQVGKRDLNKAIEAYSKAVTFKPDLPEAHYNLVNAYLAQGNFLAAVKAGEQAFKLLGQPLKPEQVQATFEQAIVFIARDYDKGLEILRSLAQRQLPKPEWYALLGQANEGLKQFSKAAVFYGQAAGLAPQVGEYHASLGWALVQIGRHTEAAKVLERATTLDNKNAFAFVALGIAYSEIGRFQEAEIALRRAVELKPQNWVARVRLANVYERLNQPPKAMQEYLSALGIKEDAAVLNNLAKLYLEQGKAAEGTQLLADVASIYQQAIQHLRRAIQIDPNLGEAHFNLAIAMRRLGKVLQQMGQMKEAEEAFKEAERVLRSILERRSDSSVKLELARLLSDLKRGDEAMKVCREVIASEPRNEDAFVLLGYIAVSLNRLDDAERAYQQALKINEKNADILVGMGVVAYLRSHYDYAISWFERALKINPNHPQAKQNLEVAKKAKERGG